MLNCLYSTAIVLIIMVLHSGTWKVISTSFMLLADDFGGTIPNTYVIHIRNCVRTIPNTYVIPIPLAVLMCSSRNSNNTVFNKHCLDDFGVEGLTRVYLRYKARHI